MRPFITACALALAACTSVPAATQRPNVVLIVCDDLNDYVGHLGGHPQARTPNLDRLAGTGVSFKRAYSNEPVCRPSRASFFTGIYPHTSGNLFWAVWYKNPVLGNSKSLMEIFGDNGYHVVGTGKLTAGDEREKGWEEYAHKADYGPMAFDGKERVGHPSVPQPYRSIGAVDGSFGPISDVPFGGTNGAGWILGDWKTTLPFRYQSESDRDPTPDERNAQWAVARLKRFAEQKDGQPFFLGVGFIRPHLPMYAPKKFFDMFPLESVQIPVIKPGDDSDCHYKDVYTMKQKGLRYFQLLKESYPTTEAGLKAFTQAYLACTAFVDEQIGAVIDAVDRSPLKDNTIIIVTSDHGFNIGQKDYLFKNAPWEESTRVPFIVRAPGVTRPGGLAQHPVALIDLYPTLVDLCGLTGDTRKNEKGRPLDGHSLRPFLKNPESRNWDGPDGALSMIYCGEDSKSKISKEDVEKLSNQQWSLRTERWRYTLYNNGAEELYDHDADPHEWDNLADVAQHATTKQGLKKQMMVMIYPAKKDQSAAPVK